jgi:hypothetical protein
MSIQDDRASAAPAVLMSIARVMTTMEETKG